MSGTYETPLSSRYASSQMMYLFSPEMKFRTWRKLWIALARAEMELGLPITKAQIEELESNKNNINYDRAAVWEKELRHDVMAHIYAYGEQCPAAKPIIHLGATSCYVGDNTDIIIMKNALDIICIKLANVISRLSAFADNYKKLPTLGFTHFQPAQLTTVGKRAALWINDLLTDLDEANYRLNSLKLLGSKGTTGTQASFLELFNGDHEKVIRLEKLISKELGFEDTVPVSGQTYSRKIDAQILSTLSGIAQSASKFATDMRLLSHLKELEEPFEGGQIGSSAMPYKRNPMRCERICSLARFVISDSQNPAFTAATQWFERTLDDSANKRLSVPEAFLATDAILNIYLNVASGIKVHEKVIERHILDELPFMATENILMNAVKRGGDRQALHEKIRVYSIKAGARIKEEGLPGNLVELIASDKDFGLSEDEINAMLKPSKFIGRSAEQVDAFLKNNVSKALEPYKDKLGQVIELKV